ncbi:hypothetical protein HZS_4307, partial [Henneguya salminicola]
MNTETASFVTSYSTSTLQTNFYKLREGIASMLYFNDKILISFSENGDISIIDHKNNKLIKNIHINEEIETIMCDSDLKLLFLSSYFFVSIISSNGRVHAYSTNKWIPIDVSDQQDDTYSCSSFCENKRKVIFGSSSDKGRFCVYNIGEWGNPSDFVYAGTGPIEHLIPLDDRTFLFSSLEGFIGSLELFPSHISGYYVKNSTDFITSLSLSHDNQILMSSHESGLNFWDVKKDLITNKTYKKSSKKLTANS